MNLWGENHVKPGFLFQYSGPCARESNMSILEYDEPIIQFNFVKGTS